MKVTVIDKIQADGTNKTTFCLECTSDHIAVIIATFAECICRGNQLLTKLLVIAIASGATINQIKTMIEHTKAPKQMQEIFLTIIAARINSQR